MGFKTSAGFCVLIIFTSSCAVKAVPVIYKCPQITLPADPIPLTKQLTDRSKPDEIIKAWVATATAYRNWHHIVRKQIDNSK